MRTRRPIRQVVPAGGGAGIAPLDLRGRGGFLHRRVRAEGEVVLSGEVEAWHIAPKYKELLDENIRCIQNSCATGPVHALAP